ncbi:hypothetical protein EDB87DRAFT_1633070 [Lactarius vividus]|nr:hypothetical protein EDB87DRAFT_1633070 [Lactarius vividus]
MNSGSSLILTLYLDTIIVMAAMLSVSKNLKQTHINIPELNGKNASLGHSPRNLSGRNMGSFQYLATYGYNAGRVHEILSLSQKAQGMLSFRRQHYPPSSWCLP